jgi:hypothetical protein
VRHQTGYAGRIACSGTRCLPGHTFSISPGLILTLLAFILVACKGGKQASTPVLFRPPTLEAAATPLPTFPPESFNENPPAETPVPTVVPVCYDSLSFLEDLTIPDGTLTSPGAILDKRWRVQNTGTCNWDERYRMKEIAGPNMGATAEQRLFPARSGSEAIIRIVFTAPSEAGTYRSAWQAYDPEDRPFGDPFFIQVEVQP